VRPQMSQDTSSWMGRSSFFMRGFRLYRARLPGWQICRRFFSER
jgi:hypothetical protein